MTPAKRERLSVLSINYMIIRKNMGDNEHPEPEGDSEDELDIFERRIEKDFDDELEAEKKASTMSLLKSRKFLIIYSMSMMVFMYPIYFNAIFKEIG